MLRVADTSINRTRLYQVGRNIQEHEACNHQVDHTRYLCAAIEQSAHLIENTQGATAGTRFVKVIRSNPGGLRRGIINHQSIRRLIEFTPLICNDTGESAGVNSSSDHEGLIAAFECRNDGELLRKFGWLVWAIRSNIAHGYKTPTGINFDAEKRDRLICEIVNPILHLLLGNMYGNPWRKLVVYGLLADSSTLRKALPGARFGRQAQLFGYIREDRGIKLFEPELAGDTVPSHEINLDYDSDDLAAVDRLEAPRFERKMLPVGFGGNLELAWVYCARRASPRKNIFSGEVD